MSLAFRSDAKFPIKLPSFKFRGPHETFAEGRPKLSACSLNLAQLETKHPLQLNVCQIEAEPFRKITKCFPAPQQQVIDWHLQKLGSCAVGGKVSWVVPRNRITWIANSTQTSRRKINTSKPRRSTCTQAVILAQAFRWETPCRVLIGWNSSRPRINETDVRAFPTCKSREKKMGPADMASDFFAYRWSPLRSMSFFLLLCRFYLQLTIDSFKFTKKKKSILC